MLGVGIIGCGAISKLHIAAFREIEGVNLIAVSDVNPDLARKTANELGVDWYSSYDDLLQRKDIDFVSICTPSGLHGEIAIKAAKAKKHIIAEKPVEVTLQKLDNIIVACRQNGVKLAGIFNNRYREGNLFLKRAVESGRFGRIINANAAIRWYREPDYYLKSSWKGTKALDGGGALMNQSIHYVDLLLWFAGEVESVFGYTAALLHKTIQTEDTAVAVLKFKSGALGSIIAGTSIYPGFAPEIQITGERGSVSISDGVITAWLFKDEDALDSEAGLYMKGEIDNSRASDPMAFDHTYHKKQFEQIVEAFSKSIEPEVNGEEARKSVELILAIYESTQHKQEVMLSN